VTTDNPVHVLLVDDQSVNLELLEASLAGLDARLVGVQSGAEALVQAQQHDFAVVLLDLRMPQMDGFETARHLRELPRARNTPILFITAADSSALHLEQAYQLGAVDLLAKPILPTVVRAKVAFFVEHFRAQQALQAERAFLAAVLEAVEDGVVACDAEGRLTLFNRATREFHGLPAEPLPPERWTDHYALYRPDGRTPLPKEEVPLYRALNGERVTGAEMVIAPHGAPPRSVVASGQPLFDAQGRKLGAVVSMHDVEMANTNRHQSEFLATLAHELRNPLAPMQNAVHLMRMAAHKPEVQQHALEVMQRQLGNLVHLVDDLMDVARISSGKVSLRSAHIPLQQVLDAALETSRPAIAAAGHALELMLPDEPVWLEADPMRLPQVLANLLTNAAKYTPPGGQIRLQVQLRADELVITVADNGVGIPEDQLNDVFAMFAQSQHSLDRAHGGLGIGLALARRLVTLHGGSLGAHSAGVGRGSTFTVRLPRRMASA
jgi:signal transduction histidine kinase/DNA-binding response OmpR family regulator